MKYQTLFFLKIRKDNKLSSAAVVNGALRINLNLSDMIKKTILLSVNSILKQFNTEQSLYNTMYGSHNVTVLLQQGM